MMTKDRYISIRKPRDEWIQYGKDSRSAVSFKENLESIIDLASKRGEQLMHMTFATYVPEGYSLMAFKDRRLDYGLHSCAIEMWGDRDYVMKTVDIHNEIIRSLATRHEDVLFVDQAILMMGDYRYFNDICHLTVVGSIRFVEYMVKKLILNVGNR